MSDIPIARPFLEQNILCIGCGYNLRGLSEACRCPECGLQVGNSARGAHLVDSDAQFLANIRCGCTLKLLNIVLTLIASFGFEIAIHRIISIPPTPIPPVGLGSALLGLLATSYLTSPEPRLVLTETTLTLRKLIRVCALVAMIGSVLQHTANPVQAQTRSGLAYDLLDLLSNWPSHIAYIVVFFGELRYLRTIALRAPDPQLASSTRIFMWIVGLGLLVFVIWMLVRGVATGNLKFNYNFDELSVITAIGFILFVGIVVPFIFIWYLALLVRYRGMIVRAIKAKGGCVLSG